MSNPTEVKLRWGCNWVWDVTIILNQVSSTILLELMPQSKYLHIFPFFKICPTISQLIHSCQSKRIDSQNPHKYEKGTLKLYLLIWPK